jgi:hypothetical protein
MKIQFIKISILLVMFFSVSSIAQKKGTQLARKPIKTEASKCSFSEKEIYLTVESLPPNYIGNNPQTITDEIVKRGNFVKDEFETTTQFQERVTNEKKKKITSELNYNSFLAFSGNDDSPFKYDANNQRMEINLAIGSSPFLRTSCQPSVSNRVNTFFYEKSGLSPYYSIKESFSIDTDNARLLKPNLRTLFIGQLNDLIGGFYTLPSVWIESINNQRKNIAKFITEVDFAKLEFNSANRELKRSEELLSEGVISKLVYDQADERFKYAKANLQVAEAKLKMAQNQLVLYINDTVIKTKDEKPAINVLLKEIWIYDISTGKIWLKKKI